MAAKSDNTKLILGTLLLAGVGILILKKKSTPYPYHNFPTVPPAPPAQTPEWQNWVSAILNTFGEVAELWQPGGPFYNQGQGSGDDIFDYTPGYQDPYDYGTIAGIGKFKKKL